MKHAIVGSLTALLAGAGLALAEPPEESPLPPPRTVGVASSEVNPEQGTVPAIVNPAFPGVSGYGPPPSFYAPVCPTEDPPFRLWTQGEYHMWWLKKNRFPPLVVGAVGDTVAVLAGGDDMDRSLRNGGGLNFGGWFTDYQGFGAEGGFFVMESSRKDFSVAGTVAPGSPVIARPFFDVLAGRTAFSPIAIPGFFSGSAGGTTANVQCDSSRFFGADVHFLGNICCGPAYRCDFLIGYRYLTLDDRFGMTTSSTAIDGLVAPNGQLVNTVTDRIDTSSRFNGADFGLRGEWHCDRFSARATARVAFGGTDESVNVSGLTTSLSPVGTSSMTAAGFFARLGNSGAFHNTQFAVVPEFNLTLGFQVFDFMRLTAGYTFLYWSNVVRSGGQVDLNINRFEVPSLTPPTAVPPGIPLAVIHCTDFWAQGLNVGLEFHY